ncbi:MAG: tRNA (adenosine(37)-N6)-threonylcarbamoyltransferase complex dimerization subunit type 1 TsaB [Alphaproteobacteria bacterium]
MLVLGINTVSDVCEAALVRGAQLVVERSEPMSQGHDARLAPLVDELMRGAGVAFAELDRIAVIVGPGSFTGVRVGIAFARGLALALERPAIGVSSLEALAFGSSGRVLAALPAKRRPPEVTWWAQMIEAGRGAGEPVEADPAMLHAMAAGASVWGSDLEIAGLDVTSHVARPTARAAARFASGLVEDDLPPPRPIYVREPDAAPYVPPTVRP